MAKQSSVLHDPSEIILICLFGTWKWYNFSGFFDVKRTAFTMFEL